MSTKEIKVGYLARVEGEGSLYIKFQGSEVEDVRLKIFEPPRFFEGFMRGRPYTEAPDITARICGICPVAYQMSAVHAMEDLLGVEIPEPIAQLRRLLYCAEWIESHTLHIFMLHAPDFLRYNDAIKMAEDHKEKVEMGLRIKKIGNELLTNIGGREIHPINVRVGGFYSWPEKESLVAMLDDFKWGRDAVLETIKWVGGFDFPDCEFDYELVSTCHDHEYPMNRGHLKSSLGLDIEASAYEQHFEEEHVEHSTALHSIHKGHGSYLTGPMARFALNFDHLTDACQQAAQDVGVTASCRNPYKSIVIRSLELLYAYEEAIRVIENYTGEGESFVPVQPRTGSGAAITEAPRGCLYHRYEMNAEGEITFAKIVPPTSQNQKRIEDDLRAIIPTLSNLSDEDLTHRCEQTVRNYDPCISCATHFLRMKIER